MLIEKLGNLKTIDKLDPSENLIDDTNLAKFLSEFDYTLMDRMDKSRPKGPDYLIIDNFEDFFGDKNIDLYKARKEAKEITDHECSHWEAAPYSRCDNLIWYKNYDTHGDQAL